MNVEKMTELKKMRTNHIAKKALKDLFLSSHKTNGSCWQRLMSYFKSGIRLASPLFSIQVYLGKALENVQLWKLQ